MSVTAQSHVALRELLRSMNGSETASLPLTVLTGGALIRGNAVSRMVWTRSLSDQVRTLDAPSSEDDIEEARSILIAKLEGQADGAVDDGGTAYLVGAVVLPLVSIPGDQLLHLGYNAWAISVDEIDGWTIGGGDAPAGTTD